VVLGERHLRHVLLSYQNYDDARTYLSRCGLSLPPNTAVGSGAEYPSTLVLPALCPVQTSVSSSLLAATMDQESSLREVTQFVSKLLTGTLLNSCRAGGWTTRSRENLFTVE